MSEEAIEIRRHASQLVAEPALRVVGIVQDARCGHGQHRRSAVMDVEDGGGGEPATLGKDKVGDDLHEIARSRLINAFEAHPLDVKVLDELLAAQYLRLEQVVASGGWESAWPIQNRCATSGCV